MTRRRTVLKGIAGAVPTGALGNASFSRSVEAADVVGRDYYAELGVQTIINAAGAYSMLGGARMRDEVIDAMRYAATHKVKMRELHDAVGARIASLVSCEAAMVTSGATASMVLGTAACMTLGDEEKMRQLPDTNGMRNEIIIQKKHRYTYDRALTVPGGRFVEVESEADIRAAIGAKTAMMFYLQPTQKGDDIPAARYIELAREFDVPSFCDAATTTPPASNIARTVSQGFDLTCYSGGKGLRGPYSAGLLLGRADLIRFARRHSAPNDISIGRGMKVSAEEYLGMLVALETALQVDPDTDWQYKYDRFDIINTQLEDVPSLSTERVTSDGHSREVYLDIDWDESIVMLSKEALVQALRDHSPAVEVRLMLFSAGRIHLSATVMDDGQAEEAGRIIRSILLRHL